MTHPHQRSRTFALCRPALAVLLLAVSLPAFAAPPVQRRVLPQGARLLVSEQPALPMAVVQILLDAGSRRDPAGKEGLAALTADLLTEGTKTRNSTQLSAAIDFLGARLNASADEDYAALSLTVLTKYLDEGLALLIDVLLNPAFDAAEVGRRREAALAALDAEEDSPGEVAARAFTKAVFGSEPYGHPATGTRPGLAGITRKDLQAFYAEHYTPAGAIITVVGDVKADDVERRLGEALRKWTRDPSAAFSYPASAAAAVPALRIEKPISQANIVLGHRGVARNNPDYYALTLMNFILGGGGFTSRLLDNIRTKAGLAYSVASAFSVNQFPGSFQIVLQTKNASARDAVQRACAEVERMRREPVSEDELRNAKLYLTGSFPQRFDTNAKIAGFLAQVEFFGLGSDYPDRYAERINSVGAEDVLRVARQYLRPEQFQLVVVGNLDEAQLSDAAPCPAP